jgi:hypothetical protein
MAHPPDSELLRAHIGKYDITQTLDTVETLYFEASQEGAAKADSEFVQ